jgi:5-methyltetrahydropteroyltriglutamate--homocysteine methyltransferase
MSASKSKVAVAGNTRRETPMRESQNRILTTHVGSLPRPDRLIEFIEAREAGEDVDEEAFEEAVREATEASSAARTRRASTSRATASRDGSRSSSTPPSG